MSGFCLLYPNFVIKNTKYYDSKITKHILLLNAKVIWYLELFLCCFFSFEFSGSVTHLFLLKAPVTVFSIYDIDYMFFS